MNPFVRMPVCVMQEEGSWEEDGRGGGMLPRPFAMWGWTMEELATYTVVRQLLLVPEKVFDPVSKVTISNRRSMSTPTPIHLRTDVQISVAAQRRGRVPIEKRQIVFGRLVSDDIFPAQPFSALRLLVIPGERGWGGDVVRTGYTGCRWFSSMLMLSRVRKAPKHVSATLAAALLTS